MKDDTTAAGKGHEFQASLRATVYFNSGYRMGHVPRPCLVIHVRCSDGEASSGAVTRVLTLEGLLRVARRLHREGIIHRP